MNARITGAVRNRGLRDEEDVRRVRRFLAQTYPRTPLGFNWDVRRWDGQRFYQPAVAWDAAWAARVQIWERVADELREVDPAEGDLVGAVILEGDFPEDDADATRPVHLTANLQVDPAWRSLDPAMLDWAEVQCLAAQRDAAGNRATPAVVPVIEVFVYTYDEARRALLAARGYTETEQSGVVRRMHFGGRDWPPPTLPPGYTLRTTHPIAAETPSAHTRTANELRKIDALARHDAQAIADLLNAAFGRDFHNAPEYLTFAQHAPSFRRDLDLVAVAPEGAIAAYVGVPYDSANRHGIFEPVCTHPEHRRLGLAQALMVEGLRRLRALGAVDVTVETGDAQAANRLYDSLGFDEIERGTVWRKELSP